MNEMRLHYFTEDPAFPFFIQYGKHDEWLEEHIHLDFCELVVVLRGRADHVVGSETYPVQKGDVFVIGENTAHGYSNARDFKICNIMFRMNHIFDPASDLCNMEGFHALFVIEPSLTKNHSFISRLSLKNQTFSTVNHMISQMIAEYEKKDRGYQTFLKTSFISLALTFSRIYQETTKTDTNQFSPLIAPISYLESHYPEEITVQQLAEISGLSTRHFNRLFQSAYQTSPVQYLLQYRIQKAEKLLHYTEMSISEIAYQCGFNDSNYFSRQFRKTHGITPRQFRKHTENMSIK
ncbi:MAG: AraC family transcriptional regulator [Eubacteriales bacterium]|nr:AraC family transcriptional regulator [Eubacteriales bacterium]